MLSPRPRLLFLRVAREARRDLASQLVARDALADHRQFAPPIGAKYPVAERAAYTAARARSLGAEAVVAVVYDGDPGPRWDVPAQREALGDIPLLLLDDQPYAPADPAALQAEVTRFLETLA